MVLSYFLRYQLLRNLVEDTYTTNGNASVHLLSHSLGGPYTNLFLVSYVSAAWKAQYIASHIQLSSPIMGSVPAIEGILSGPMYDYIPQFLPSLIVPAIRSFPSIAWMFPRVYGGYNARGGAHGPAPNRGTEDPIFISTPTHNYTLSTLGDLAKAVNATVIIDQWFGRKSPFASIPISAFALSSLRTDAIPHRNFVQSRNSLPFASFCGG